MGQQMRATFALILGLSSWPVHAALITVDFESLRVDSLEQVILHGTSYTEDGVDLTITCCEPFGSVQQAELYTSGTQTAIFPGSLQRCGRANHAR